MGKFPDGACAVINDFSCSVYQGPEVRRWGPVCLLFLGFSRCSEREVGRIRAWITDRAFLGMITVSHQAQKNAGKQSGPRNIRARVVFCSQPSPSQSPFFR